MSLIRPLFFGLIILLPAGAVSAVTWTVEQISGCSDSTCNPCCTIQGAVYKSVGGDTISVAPGNYPEIIDFRNMLSVGDITLEAASGPGTVLISSSADEPLRHSSTYTNTVTLDGLDITSGGGYSCVYFNHLGDAVLRDVTANDCAYTAIMLDNPGSVTMERCTANSSGRTGIQIDGASSASVIDCTANSNVSTGIDVYSLGNIDIINPTTIGNWDGLKVFAVAPTTITGATTTGNGRDGIVVETTSSLIITNPSANGNAAVGINLLTHDSTTITNGTASNNVDQGIWAWSTATVSIEGTTVSGNGEGGIDIDWDGVTPAGGVTLTDTEASHNGHTNGDSGVRLRNINGDIVVTNSTFSNNGSDGFSLENSVIGDLEIYGGLAYGNAEDGYDLRVTGNATVIGAVANNNIVQGFKAEIPGTVFFQNCIASNNEMGSGFDLEWQDPDRIDGISVVECTAVGNGLLDGGEGISIRHVDGPVTVRESVASGNAYSGVRIRDAYGTVLIRDVTAIANLEEGIEIDIDGPATIVDNIVDGNIEAGLDIDVGDLALESFTVKRNTITDNGGTGVVVWDLGGPGPYAAKCNDINGNGDGMYLDGSLTVDARWIWWGDSSGPSGQGPGVGDGVYAQPGGTIVYDPWLTESFAAPVSGCPFFDSGFETGQLEEWDHYSP